MECWMFDGRNIIRGGQERQGAWVVAPASLGGNAAGSGGTVSQNVVEPPAVSAPSEAFADGSPRFPPPAPWGGGELEPAAGSPSGGTAGPADCGEPGVERAARMFSDNLAGILARAMGSIQERTAGDRSKLEAASGKVARLSREIGQLKADLVSVLSRLESLDREGARARSETADLEDRVGREEAARGRFQEQVERFSAAVQEARQQVEGCSRRLADLEAQVLGSAQRFDVLDWRVQGQAEAAAALSSRSGRLEESHQRLRERVDAQEKALQALRQESQQRTVLMERLLGMFRGLELREESRLPADLPVNLVVLGEREEVLCARIANVSGRGLGLVSGTPLPVGTEVRIAADGTAYRGTARYCRREGQGYAVGLSLIPEPAGRA